MPGRTVLTVGTFDGVHRGHAALLARAREAAGAGGRIVALAFDPHPISVLVPEKAPPRLSTFEGRSERLLDAGADEVERLEPTRDLLGLSPEAFVDLMLERYAPAAFVEGADFRFGARRAGDVRTLEQIGARRGFDVDVVEPVEVELADQSIVIASSTILRWLLEQGRVRDAARVLGRPYELVGTIARGERRGRGFGFPTANLYTDQTPPRDGVYAGVATLPTGDRRAAAISVGTNPTVEGRARTVEAYVLDWDGGGAPEYGWPLRLAFTRWLREQVRYGSVDAMLEQMRRDAARTREADAAPAPPGFADPIVRKPQGAAT